MKKLLLCLLAMLTLSTGLFAQNWNAGNLKNDKTTASLASKFGLKLVEEVQIENGNKKLYKTGDNWICVLNYGNKKNKDDLYFFAYAFINDKSESYFTYSYNVENSSTYLSATIKENNTTIESVGVDFEGGVYTFPNPEQTFASMFINRIDFYYDIFDTFSKYELLDMNYMIDRYAYFAQWIEENPEPTAYELIEEYKAYLRNN